MSDAFWTAADIWRELDPIQREQVRQRFPWRREVYAAGQCVALQGDPLERLMLLESGALSAEIIDPQGKVLKVETLLAGAILAGPVLFADDARLPVQLTADCQAAVVSLSKRDAVRLLGSYPAVLQSFLRESGEKVLFLAEKIRLLRFASIREKLAGHFLELARRGSCGSGRCRIRLSYSLEALADLFGVTRPALSRCLGELVDEGLVERCGKGQFVINCQSLRQLLDA
ncbi:Crp/Fnr family transcriptional regulator [Spirochaeta africana]|uniref:cAMP-binding protein n=1 Tax=Spirochaeta africana (strain ATCC 700263 / DSM 8902 / Z-7692) TaxID=889378 RepID=H9UL87_SPIAZ|nr:Crp/Fnr family transcriptional regulator [Spirochaeta africana]AFG38280.1 cAMP-binding protein [Spirochaeta africana DSM 8902]